MRSPGSTPGGTSMKPVARCPCAALAVPTVKVGGSPSTTGEKRKSADRTLAATLRRLRINSSRNPCRIVVRTTLSELGLGGIRRRAGRLGTEALDHGQQGFRTDRLL